MILKNIFDYIFALTLIIIFAVPVFILWIVSSIDTQQNGIFIQQRIGKNEKPFYILKIRTMMGNYTSSVTTSEMKVTRLGKFLRKYKLDELLQLINILKGEMSFVGPRPDTKEMTDLLSKDEKFFLSIKPGITEPAQIKYKNEEEIILQQPNPETYYKNIIWKDKVLINNEYVKNRTFFKDIIYILKTIF